MKIAIIGHGRMGKEIKKIAEQRGIEVKSIIDPNDADAEHNEITEKALEGVDVCIDFTHPDVVVENIKKIAKLGKNIVVGTTAWYDELDKVKKIVEESKIGFIYAPNFSIGVNVFFRIIKDSAKYFNKLPDYDVFVSEEHHNKKADSPSGTAKKIGKILLDGIERKKETIGEINAPIKPEQLNIVGVRGGAIPGNHSVVFDSQADTIRLNHSARSRQGFAIGAITAAEWVNDKKGFFNIDDMMDEIVK